MDSQLVDKLKQRWFQLNDNINPDVCVKWWDKIYEEYSSNKFRKHHSFEHIDKMFNHLEEFKKCLKSPVAISYAIFFKNLYYDPKSTENEEKNVELFEEFASEAGFKKDDEFYQEIIELILLTKTHLTEEHQVDGLFGNDDKHFFLDFDLSYLGSQPEEYAVSAMGIREEYNFIPDQTYKSLRSKVLTSLLEIPNIYATKVFYEKFENQARSNINKEIEVLK